jgi:DMSO/TMAO reductase YedYZ molybdopterin-dependent catalytic subunit
VKNKIFQTLLLITTLCLFLSVFLRSSSGLEFYVTNVAMEDNSEWILQVDGAVNHPVNLTLTELIAMPKANVYAELYCYGKLVTSGLWTGVTLESILQKAEFEQQVKSVEFYAEDGYEVTLSITDVLQKGLIAYELDGQSLPETLRLVFPGANGDRWIAMITHISASMKEASPLPPVSANILPELPSSPEQSPTPQPSPTPPPTSSPSPSISPSPDPSPSPLTPETKQNSQKPFPLTWTLTAIAVVATVSSGLIVLFKKRNK